MERVYVDIEKKFIGTTTFSTTSVSARWPFWRTLKSAFGSIHRFCTVVFRLHFAVGTFIGSGAPVPSSRRWSTAGCLSKFRSFLPSRLAYSVALNAFVISFLVFSRGSISRCCWRAGSTLVSGVGRRLGWHFCQVRWVCPDGQTTSFGSPARHLKQKNNTGKQPKHRLFVRWRP